MGRLWILGLDGGWTRSCCQDEEDVRDPYDGGWAESCDEEEGETSPVKHPESATRTTGEWTESRTPSLVCKKWKRSSKRSVGTGVRTTHVSG